jgi:hypothetical protein
MKTFLNFISGLLLVFTSMLSFGQAGTPAVAVPKRTVTIPFTFWIADRQMPSGEYVIETIADPDILLFRTKDGKKQQQVFLMTVTDTDTKSDPKLVFVVHNSKNTLAEVWNKDHKLILTSRFGLSPVKGDTTREVKVLTSKASGEEQPQEDQEPGEDTSCSLLGEFPARLV